MTGHYPLNHHPARLAIEHLEQFSFGWRDISRWFSAAQSIIFVLTTIAVANVVRLPYFLDLFLLLLCQEAMASWVSAHTLINLNCPAGKQQSVPSDIRTMITWT